MLIEIKTKQLSNTNMKSTKGQTYFLQEILEHLRIKINN